MYLTDLIPYFVKSSKLKRSCREADTPFDISLQISFTPKFPDSVLVVRASGNFRVINPVVGVCSMNIMLYDSSTLLNSKMGFLHNAYSASIHHNPNMLHVDSRSGLDQRNYKLALLRHASPSTTQNSLSYYPAYGAGSISVEEYQNA